MGRHGVGRDGGHEGRGGGVTVYESSGHERHGGE